MLHKGQKVEDKYYPKVIIKYLEGKGIGWIASVYDPQRHHCMLESWDTYELTGVGEFF
jgi:hypothetical protein